MNNYSYPAIDLHCDLLDYLINPLDKRSPYDTNLLCNMNELVKGNVILQVLAIFTRTQPDSTTLGFEQLRIFRHLASGNFPVLLKHHEKKSFETMTTLKNPLMILSIENMSGFISENEPIKPALKKFEEEVLRKHPLAYISLTWNELNRFGGGQPSNLKLTDDGKRILDLMAKYKIPLDFSHASDELAFSSLDYIDKQRLPIRVIASHSNFRAVTDHKRNLPDDLAKEIIKRKGLIGINFAKKFITNKNDEMAYIEHIKYGVDLGAAENLSFGIDIFDVTDHLNPPKTNDELNAKIDLCYFRDYARSSVYPKLQTELEESNYSFDKNFLMNLFYKNALNFYQEVFK